LWRSNGTAAGTVRVKDINPGSVPFDLTNIKGMLFFSADTGNGNLRQLWITRIV
jgi:hypothetical protein